MRPRAFAEGTPDPITVVSRDPIAMPRAPITPGNATCSERAGSDRSARSDRLLRQAPKGASVTLRSWRVSVTTFFSRRNVAAGSAGCRRTQLIPCIRRRCGPYVRSRCDPRWAAPLNALVSTLAIAGQVPFPNLSCPGPSVSPNWPALFAHNWKGFPLCESREP